MKHVFSISMLLLVYHTGFSQWAITGNSVSTSTTITSQNFLGTTNASPLRFRTSTATAGNNIDRMVILPGGNVGIGLTTPTALLHFAAGTTTVPALKLSAGVNLTTAQSGAFEFDGTNLFFTPSAIRRTVAFTNTTWSTDGNAGTINTNYIGTSDATDLRIKTNATDRIFIQNSTGNVGIGNSLPTKKLEVEGNASVIGALYIKYANLTQYPNGNGWINFHHSQQDLNGIYFAGISYANLTGNIHTSSNTGNIQSYGTNFQVLRKVWNTTTNQYDYTSNFIVDQTGNVGIGSTTPTHKLDVNGNIFTNSKILVGSTLAKAGNFSMAVNGDAIFNRVVVKLYGSWPDYVFDKSYSLTPIEEVEEFISTNKHLKGLQPSSEIEKKGVDIGETQKVLTEKVEELTLYLIEQNKLIKQLQKEIDAIKNK
jgi:hypothetical protein